MRVPTPTRICRVKYLAPYDFLDLQIFVKFLLIRILRIYYSSGMLHLHASSITIYEIYMSLRISHISQTPRLFPEFPPTRPLSLTRILFVDHFTPHTARPYLGPRWLYASAYIRVPRARWHIPPVHAHTEKRRERERKREKENTHTHTQNRHTTGYTLGARARIRSRDGRSAWMHGRRRSCDRQLSEGGVCTFRRLYAMREESAAVVRR